MVRGSEVKELPGSQLPTFYFNCQFVPSLLGFLDGMAVRMMRYYKNLIMICGSGSCEVMAGDLDIFPYFSGMERKQ